MTNFPNFVGWLGTVIIAAVSGGFGGAALSYYSHDRELDIKMVELGLSMLRTEPKEGKKDPSRDWAIKVVERYSGVDFNPEARKNLLETGAGFSVGFIQQSQERALRIPLGTSLAQPCPQPPDLTVGEDARVGLMKFAAAYKRCQLQHQSFVDLIEHVANMYGGKEPMPGEVNPPKVPEAP